MAKLVFNENDLTIGDMEDFEDAVGVPLTEALKPVKVRDDEGNLVRHSCAESGCDESCKDNGRPEETVNMTAKVLKALIWIASRQDNPDFTLEDARNVKVTELDIVRRDDESEDSDPKGDSE